jgi:hypothetical protein
MPSMAGDVLFGDNNQPPYHGQAKARGCGLQSELQPFA